MHSLITLAVYLIALAVCGVAVRFGDKPLRFAAIAYMAGWVLTTLLARRIVHGLDFPVTMIDLNTTLALVWISLRWRRLWCAALAAQAIVTTLIPIVRLIHHDDVSRYAMMATQNILAIVQLATLAIAIVITVRARGRADEGAVPA